MGLRSQEILKRPRWSKVRSLFKSMGYSDLDLERPIIGIANSWSSLVSGHYNLKQVAEYVKQGILQAGGTPVEFGVIGACDGIASGHEGGKYILPSRELIAGSVETMVQAHRLDGVAMLGSCDKIIPGMLMAAARIDLPAIIVNGGPAEGGCGFDGRSSDITSISEALGMLQSEKIDETAFHFLEDNVMPSCGSCSFLGTANSMACAAEALGICLPGTSTIPATRSERLRAAQKAGHTIVNMVKNNITSRKLINRKSIDNAVRVNAAIGGSTNIALHIPAIAYEAGIPVDMAHFGELCSTTPYIAKMNPAGDWNMSDFHKVGGVPAVMKAILPLLNKDSLTVTGKSVEENLSAFSLIDSTMIRSMDNPWNGIGGLAVLKGNLAPDTAVTKPAAIHPDMYRFKGGAKCFDSEEEANQAILNGGIQAGDILVIRYEGPKGGPGMREMAYAMKLLYGKGLALKTAVVTDGRFSGTNNGCFVGHVSPEAAQGGPIALIKDGDTIDIDIRNGRLDIDVDKQELEERFRVWKKPKPKIRTGYLGVYAKLVSSASEGAVLKT
ncbi:MAG: dihydroxy-acid dehydratase [Bacteroidales bacterium]